ncbi:HEAT repeat domain-containing protein [Ferrovibrio sp.]|uniref:HEAT repeat domain-containing protein n=1 Tax=Ferrovibrio sp. TaxID=1917215 RepID=UPI00311DF33F
MSAAADSTALPAAATTRGRNEWRRTLEILLPCLLLLAAQTGLLWLAFTGRIGLLPFACFHIGIVLLVLGWAYSFRRGGRINRFAMLLAVTGGFFGPLGTLGLAVITPLQVLLRRQATPFEQWYAALFPEDSDDEDEKLYRLVASGRAANQALSGIDSFTDVMRLGSIEQKRAVLMLLARRFRPEFAPALKQGLQDSNAAIRVQAATAAAEIEDSFTTQTLELEAAVQAEPDSFDRHLALARHYDSYAFCGLLDAAREHAGRRAALQHYGECLKLNPRDTELRMAICRILVREGRYADAVDWLGQRLQREGASRAIVGWYLECLFQLHRYGEVHGIVTRFRDLLQSEDGDGEDRLDQSARLWLAADRGVPA